MIGTKTKQREAKGKAPALGLLVAALMAACLLLTARPAHAATFTVNSTGDLGDQSPGDGSCFTGIIILPAGTECTLRAALQEANVTSGADTIAFNIPGNGPHTISPTSGLPIITKPVTIDGYTQGDVTPDTADDATENTLTQPDKTNAILKIELNGTGKAVPLGLRVTASNVVVKGLAINNFGEGIFFLNSTGNMVEGNFIGTNPSGTSADGNSNGMHLAATNGSTIGGTSPEARNLISGNDGFGVWLEGGPSGNRIQGNLIGPDRNGGPLGNGDAGVELSTSGTGNRILSNSIFFNGFLGIDLRGDGITLNDLDDPNTPKPDPDKDIGPNNLQNFPDITSATRLLGTTTISGELNSTPSTRKKKRTFTIQFFSSPVADPSGFGEGKTFLGEIQVKTDRQGKASFNFAPAQSVPEGEFVTATAMRHSTGDTSEFSDAERVVQSGIGG